MDGLKLAERFAFELAQAGFVIVSGLAQGVDTAAHKGALAAGGRTIAVMATGIDTVYPSANRQLSLDIAASGAVVTEFFPGSAPKRHHFRRRNRTISGLSIATVVIEAGVPSGTLITATAAAEQGRDVYALPWSINHKHGEGCLKLLLEGALLATDPNDIIEGVAGQSRYPPRLYLKITVRAKVPWRGLEISVLMVLQSKVRACSRRMPALSPMNPLIQNGAATRFQHLIKA